MALANKRLNAIQKKSEMFSKGLLEIEPLVFEYAVKKKLDKKIMKKIRSYQEIFDKMAERTGANVIGNTMTMAIMVQTFSQPVVVRSIVKANRAELSTEVLSVLEQAMDTPWYITAFEVLGVEGPHILRIYDFDDGEEYLLDSKSVTDSFKSGISVFYCLLFYNGECLQTYGAIYSLSWADGRDFEYLAKRLNQQKYLSHGLSEVFTQNPVTLTALWTYAGIPSIGHRGETAEVCTSVVSCSDFHPDDFTGNPKIFEKNGSFLLILDEEDPMFGPRIIYDAKHKRCYLKAMTERCYHQGREAAAPEIVFPEGPDSIRSLTMDTAVQALLGPEDYMQLDAELAEDRPLNPEEEEVLEKANAVFSRLMDTINKGETVDIREIAHDTGADIEMVKSAYAEIKKVAGSNKLPDKDFSGISPNHMRTIINRGIDEMEDIVKLRPERTDPRQMARALYPALALELLRLVRKEGGLKLTAKGNLPLKIVRPLHALYLEKKKEAGERVYDFQSSEHIMKEEQSIQVDCLHRIVVFADYIEVSKTHAWLSDKAVEVLNNDDTRTLYTDLITATADRFELTYFTRIECVALVQDSLPFSLYLMKKMAGKKLTAKILAEKLYKAFPGIVDELDFTGTSLSPLKWLETAVNIEIFSRFCLPFGLVSASPDMEEKGPDRIFTPSQYHMTPLFHDFFDWKI